MPTAAAARRCGCRRRADRCNGRGATAGAKNSVATLPKAPKFDKIGRFAQFSRLPSATRNRAAAVLPDGRFDAAMPRDRRATP